MQDSSYLGWPSTQPGGDWLQRRSLGAVPSASGAVGTRGWLGGRPEESSLPSFLPLSHTVPAVPALSTFLVSSPRPPAGLSCLFTFHTSRGAPLFTSRHSPATEVRDDRPVHGSSTATSLTQTTVCSSVYCSSPLRVDLTMHSPVTFTLVSALAALATLSTAFSPGVPAGSAPDAAFIRRELQVVKDQGQSLDSSSSYSGGTVDLARILFWTQSSAGAPPPSTPRTIPPASASPSGTPRPDRPGSKASPGSRSARRARQVRTSAACLRAVSS